MINYQTTSQHPRLGFEVCQGLNLKTLTSSQRLGLKHALWQHGVIFARKQYLTASEMEQFALDTFGPMMIGDNRQRKDRPPLPPELVSNHVAVLGNPLGSVDRPLESAAWQWHHDKDALPRLEGLAMNALYIVMLHIHKVPGTGCDGQPHTTHFLDQLEAWRALSPERQAELRAVKLIHSPPFLTPDSWTAETPLKPHPLVSEHELIAREGLYMGSDTAIPVGLEKDPEAARTFWQALLDEILASCVIYAHRWQEGDIVFWDNSQVMHRGQPYDSRHHQRVGLRLGVVAREETTLRHLANY
ncbi:TauD/TfdA family dioxygenase [Thalassotalea sp. G20_0]|uniref:TauD/TfdA dioxygenase family protein n=1 Tax=Thalassotalea sp. G20_0 TaxID=2821093 RepID=UPI001ADC18D2|nr:TauD/TfdA family dioxygenase [Thalassotalea sp. G20_0]MBO9494071.1 TauD/TfdA family dioxygenase [Thalassotalea sp. G20_0]